MTRLAHHRLFVVASGMLAILATLAVPMAANADNDAQEQKLIVGPDNEIYGTQEAADLVAEARKFDPMFCPREQADRDKAATLYQKAIAAQPGAKLNAPLADRVAQLYAFYEDKEKKVSPNRSTANQWWNRCIDSTSPNQLLWAQAQMGLASMAVGGGDHLSAVQRYNKILNLDISQIELPDWKVWPDANTERGKAAIEREQARLRESVEGIRFRAAEKQFYVLGHISKDVALDSLQSVAVRYKGTPTGERASNMIATIRAGAKNPWALPEHLMDKYEPQVQQTSPVRQQEPQEETVAAPVPLAVTKASGWNYWGLSIAVLATAMAAVVAAGIVWIRRRSRSIIRKGA